MTDLFNANARIQINEDGILFSEQDIIFSRYNFQGDLKIRMKLDYLRAGFGVVIAEKTADTPEESEKITLYKLGGNVFNVIKREILEQRNMKETSNLLRPGKDSKNITLVFTISGKKIRFIKENINEEDDLLGEYKLSNTIDEYNVGFYSSTMNILKEVDFIEGIPKQWVYSIKNTGGGKVTFLDDGFSFENCNHYAELEQDKIMLKAGTYHIGYESKDVNGMNDIKAYVFPSKAIKEDESFEDEKKKINVGNILKLKNDTMVNVKFLGKNGLIKNIKLTDVDDGAYVRTEESERISNGSYITVKTKGLAAIKWEAKINSVPSQAAIKHPDDYGILITSGTVITDIKADIMKGNRYFYNYDVKKKIFRAYVDKDSIVPSAELPVSIDKLEQQITIMKNMDASVYSLILVAEDGTETNVLVQKTVRKYVPATIKGPIIVTDDHDISLNLSASYREVVGDSEDDFYYVFTNYEREIFKRGQRLLLENAMTKNSIGTTLVYGCNGEIDLSKLYRVPSESLMTSIDLCCSDYDLIPETKYEKNFSISEIRLDQEIKDDYDYFIVDYLKDSSYSVNFIEEDSTYEVEIMLDGEAGKLCYDMDEEGNVLPEYITDIDPEKKGFVVIQRREDEFTDGN